MNYNRIASARRADLPSMLPNLRRVGEDKYRGPCAFHGGDNPSGMVVDRRRDGSWGWQCFTGDCGLLGVKRPPSFKGDAPVFLICDACRNETAEVAPRQYGNGKSRPYRTTTALQEAGALGWEIAGSVNACIGPRCLERMEP